MITLSERQSIINEVYHRIKDTVMSNLRVSGPGIIQSFDKDKQTFTVKLAIKERMPLETGEWIWKEIPVLVDCPLKMQRGGGYVATFPFKAGDECLVVFGDRDMDAWWQSGGVQQYIRGRKHDLSDGYVLPGITSQSGPVQNYSPDSMQIRNEDGTIVVDLNSNTKTLSFNAPYISMTSTENDATGVSVNITSSQDISVNTSKNATVTASENVSITGNNSVIIAGNGNTTIEERVFMNHVHKGVLSGSGNTQGVV
jgi:hypothetical protein